MTLVEHANKILGYLLKQRRADGTIPAIANVDLLRAITDSNPSDYAVTFGQANSLLDIACLQADLPLIGRLVEFDHKDSKAGPWVIWNEYSSLLYFSAPRVKKWSDEDLQEIRTNLKSGSPRKHWKSMEAESELWLRKALRKAQSEVEAHVRTHFDSATLT